MAQPSGFGGVHATEKASSAMSSPCAVDTTTPAGEAMATFSQFERRLISQRTRDALAMKRKQGVQLRRPQSIPPKLARRIKTMRSRGMTLQAICDKLNGEGVPTPRGGSA